MRPYQIAAHEAVARHWAGPSKLGAMLVMATGSGKTRTGLHIVVSEFLDKGKTGLWLAHRDELITQPRNELTREWFTHGVKSGIVANTTDEPTAPMVFASMQTLERSPKRAEAIGHRDVVVVDEVHHACSPSYERVLDRVIGPHTKVLGLTATADRDDGKDLGQRFEIAFSYDLVNSISDGWLIPPYAVVHQIPGLDLSQVSGRRDYDDAELGAALLKAKVVEHTVEAMRGVHKAVRLPRRDHNLDLRAKGRSTIVFTATVEQARLTAEALRAEGWTAAVVSAGTPKADRKRLLTLFQAGKIEVLCNAGILTEGTDLPRCSCVVLARPTRSWPLFVQMLGRGARLFDPHWDKSWGPCNALDARYRGDRDCLVIDLSGCTSEHSLVGAPILIGGGCRHQWVRSPDGHGYCAVEGCDAKIACYASLGPHAWDDAGRCTACDAQQCPASPEGRHVFRLQPDYKRKCDYCEATVANPLASLLDGRETRAIEVDPVRVEGAQPETWMVDGEDKGALFISGDRTRDRWLVVWVYPTGEARSLTPGPVGGWLAREYARDVGRRVLRVQEARVRGPEPKSDVEIRRAVDSCLALARSLL